MNRATITRPRALARNAGVRLAAALALAAPASAVAATPVADAVQTGKDRAALPTDGLRSGPSEEVLNRIPDPFNGGRSDRTGPNRTGAGPFHPVVGKVSYGDAQAAFGHARGRPHEGQDIFAPAGTTLVAAADGVVVDGGTDGGRGNWVAIYDPERKQTYSYFHMLGPATVAVGEKVRAGKPVGEVGCTGSCWGDHLHFEVRDGRGPYGAAMDPMPLLGKWDRVKG